MQPALHSRPVSDAQHALAMVRECYRGGYWRWFSRGAPGGSAQTN
ncbi:hypothetical protein SAMN02745148_00850 [Modicisalibacter ilicicola DSM 19980]|uniref:Uncharacterized protein n=1 Tax=Modicisalibacter ilicicola DSM 19980 TaxID=1121942 RepID=A0A1M4V447_9GAMM|nr:hypothetical protein [Halomonas ilicicola]SHE63761.1 hypothetical protein SAMN02745148_00850 [Halomonas ilicicola DSM 19980]